MRKPRTSIRDLLLPSVVIRDNSDPRTRLASGHLAKNISAPCLVSSTNAALDPYCFEKHIPHQPDSPIEVFQCLSGAELSNTPADTKREPRIMLMTHQPHAVYQLS